MTPKILAARHWKNNAELMADVAALGYLRPTDSVLDPTFGNGAWWRIYRPLLLARPEPGTDFRSLPHGDSIFDAVAYDPPYVCVDAATEILTARGWLRWSDVRTGDEAYTLNHQTGLGEWNDVEAVLVLPPAHRLMLSMTGQAHSSLTTLDHRWPVLRRRRSGERRAYEREFSTSRDLVGDDLVPLAAPWASPPREPKFSDALVELVAWFWTEGTLDRRRDGNLSTYGNIVQSHVVNDPYCARIRAAFTAEFGPPVVAFPRVGRRTDGIPRWREAVDGHKAVFWFSSDLGAVLTAAAPQRVPTTDFLRSLTSAQLRLFIETSIDADGCRSRARQTLGQARRDAIEAFQTACTLAGIPTSLRETTTERGPYYTLRLRTRATMRVGRNRPTQEIHRGIVWCVRTANQTWLARRDGSVFFTGNCPGGRETTGIPKMFAAYGMDEAPRNPEEGQRLINDGLTEMARVVRPATRKKLRRLPDDRPNGIVLAKCADYVWSGHVWWGVEETVKHGRSIGLELIDRFEHVAKGPGPQPARSRKDGRPSVQEHASRNLSTLLVFRRRQDAGHPRVSEST